MKTKIFCDIADLNQIIKFNRKKIVRGFTTNPTLVRKAGAKNYKNYCKKILDKTKKPVSIEVFGDDEDSMISQGMKISKWGKNVYVKIPVVNSKGKFMGKVLSYLSKKKIKINITAVYSSSQTKKILKKVGIKSDIIISIFAGRLADKGIDPTPEFNESIRLIKKYKNTKILWASTREPYNYIQAKKINCHLITIPPNMITKIENFGASKNQLSIDTVKNFLTDSKKSNFKL